MSKMIQLIAFLKLFYNIVMKNCDMSLYSDLLFLF